MNPNNPIPGTPPPGAPVAIRAAVPQAQQAPQVVTVAQAPVHEVDGPLGPKKITSANVAQAAALAEAVRAAQTAPQVDPPSIPEGDKKEKVEDKDPLEEELERTDLYEEMQNRLRQGDKIHDPVMAMLLSFMDSKARRKKVESRILAPLDYNTYVLRREFRQVIQIWPIEGAPVVELRSMTGQDLLIMRELLSQPQYFNPLVGEMASPYLTAAIGLVRIGDDVMEDLPRSLRGDERKKVILKRLERILEEPHDIIWDIYVNHLWFQARCRKVLYGSDSPF